MMTQNHLDPIIGSFLLSSPPLPSGLRNSSFISLCLIIRFHVVPYNRALHEAQSIEIVTQAFVDEVGLGNL